MRNSDTDWAPLIIALVMVIGILCLAAGTAKAETHKLGDTIKVGTLCAIERPLVRVAEAHAAENHAEAMHHLKTALVHGSCRQMHSGYDVEITGMGPEVYAVLGIDYRVMTVHSKRWPEMSLYCLVSVNKIIRGEDV